MNIPNPNINAYRHQYATANNQAQLIPTLCNPDIHNQRMIGEQRAIVVGIYDEGARYRGYGCYKSNAACNCCNNYCPIYYNTKNAPQGSNDWFISYAND